MKEEEKLFTSSKQKKITESDAMKEEITLESSVVSVSESTVNISQTESGKTCNKCLQNLSSPRASLLLEIIRTTVHLMIAFSIFLFFEHKNTVTFKQKSYFSSEQVVYPSQIRGLFPPMKGNEEALIGKWRVVFTNSLELSDNSIFSNFTLEFKEAHKLRVKRIGCDGDLTMKWETFQFNIFIEETPRVVTPEESFNETLQNDSNGTIEELDSSMTIEPDEYDIKCIEGDGNFFFHLKDASVWTFDEEEKLYILVQREIKGRNIESILLLESG